MFQVSDKLNKIHCSNISTRQIIFRMIPRFRSVTTGCDDPLMRITKICFERGERRAYLQLVYLNQIHIPRNPERLG